MQRSCQLLQTALCHDHVSPLPSLITAAHAASFNEMGPAQKGRFNNIEQCNRIENGLEIRFKEVRALRELDFNFADKAAPMRHVQGLASHMQVGGKQQSL